MLTATSLGYVRERKARRAKKTELKHKMRIAARRNLAGQIADRGSSFIRAAASPMFRQRAELKRQLSRRGSGQHLSNELIIDVFRKLDKDKSGSVDHDEFVDGLATYGIDGLGELFDQIDQDGSGQISFEELSRHLRGEGARSAFAKQLTRKLTDSGKRMAGLLGTISSRPLHVPIIVTSVGVFTMGFTAPSLGVAIACQEIFSGINDLSVSLLNELTATSIPPSQFQSNQALGQWLRRLGARRALPAMARRAACRLSPPAHSPPTTAVAMRSRPARLVCPGNCLTAFTGPVLFGVDVRLPFLLYGGVVTAWGLLVLWPSIYAQARTIAKGVPVGAFPPVTAFRCFTYGKPWDAYESEYAYATAQSARSSMRSVQFSVARLTATVRRLNGEVERLNTELEAMKSSPPAE